jgi:S-adenosylmethionine-dependent methyltransferase
MLCHGVVVYVDQPDPPITSLCRCAAADGIVSMMALNAKTLAIRPALKRRWADALGPLKPALNAGRSVSIPGRTPSRN